MKLDLKENSHEINDLENLITDTLTYLPDDILVKGDRACCHV